MIRKTLRKELESTAPEINERVMAESFGNVSRYANEDTDQRLLQLKQEWDTERFIEVEAGAVVLAGSLLAYYRGGRWAAIPAFASAMLLLHALNGWYPWLPLIRRVGVRTPYEVGTEAYALKAVRGDFKDVSSDPKPSLADVTTAVDAAHV